MLRLLSSVPSSIEDIAVAIDGIKKVTEFTASNKNKMPFKHYKNLHKINDTTAFVKIIVIKLQKFK